MKLEINLDESRFKDLVDEELGKFSDAELHDILGKAISQYVIDNGILEKLFYYKKKNYYGDETGEIEATPRLERIVQNIDMAPTLEKLKNDIQTLLKKDDTVKRLAENLFYRFISQKIDDMIWRNTTLQSLIQIQAGQMIDNKFNNK
jgi:uncharacterized protein YdaL